MFIKILQTSDNHIGETAYTRIDSDTGLNARGLDFFRSFERIARIALEKEVNVLLVVGDFFTKVNPNQRYILEAMKMLRKLAKAGVESILVGGNHETPKLATTVNPLALLEQIDGVHVALEPKTITIEDVDFVCVPSPSNFDEIRNMFRPLLQRALATSKAKKKVLAAHIPIAQTKVGAEYTLETFVGEAVDAKQIPKEFDYVALGHMHRFQRVQHDSMPIYYSGSSERVEFSEEGMEKYAILVNLEEKAKPHPIKLQVRDMITVIDENCSGLPATKITNLVLDRIEEKKDRIKDAIARIKLDNISLDEHRLIDWNAVKERLTRYGTFDYKLQPQTVVSLPAEIKGEGEYIFPPPKELELYVKSKKEYRGIRRDLIRLGNEVIEEAKETTL